MAVTFIPRKSRASELLIEIEAIHFNQEDPFIFTSGWASPVYIDCRKLISFPRQRREIIQLAAEEIDRSISRDRLALVAGGETAGIPLAAWIAEYFFLPMIYVRKNPKGFGRMNQIEGMLEPGTPALLVEDLTTDGRSKINFCNALRRAGAIVDEAVVIFYYGVYPDAEKNLEEAGITLHALTDWRTTLEVARASGYFDKQQSDVVEEFLDAPHVWSKAHGGV
jgi:orotate phosphoribosyltransferase